MQPIVIIVPPYTEQSNGVKSLHKIAHTINNDQNYSLMYGTFAGSAGTISGQTLMVNGELGQATAKSCTLGVVTNSTGQFSGCVSSDEKLKTDLTNFGSTLASGTLGGISSSDFAISMINELNPVTYNWISTSTHGGGTHLGFIAEQVQQVDPDAVSAAGTVRAPA